MFCECFLCCCVLLNFRTWLLKFYGFYAAVYCTIGIGCDFLLTMYTSIDTFKARVIHILLFFLFVLVALAIM